MELCCFADAKKLNEHLSGKISTILQKSINEKGKAYIAVSGGRTPIGLFQHLATQPLQWENVTVTLTDERWLDPSHQDSNEHLVKKYLLQKKAANAGFISLYVAADNARAGITEINQRLSGIPDFDVVILGMGEDGHTASLFPCSAELADALAESSQAAHAISPQSAPYKRISLSRKRLIQSEHLFLHILGEKKRTVLNKAMNNTNILEMPVRAFLKQKQLQVMYAPHD